MFIKAIKSVTPLPLLDSIVGRKHRNFALGPPKSGTTSIARMFQNNCRSGHEALRPYTVNAMHKHYLGSYSDNDLCYSYLARDKQLLLELESNCFLAYRPDLLLSCFPTSKFLITVRQPLSWLDSILDNNVNYPRNKTPTMTQWHEVMFSYSEETVNLKDQPLIDQGLYPLATYLNYWASTYEKCLSSIPKTQRLVVGTNNISQQRDYIASFMGISLDSVQTAASHANKTTEKHKLRSLLDPEYVQQTISSCCDGLIQQFNLEELWAEPV